VQARPGMELKLKVRDWVMVSWFMRSTAMEVALVGLLKSGEGGGQGHGGSQRRWAGKDGNERWPQPQHKRGDSV
jgi:hypothetical protein